MLSAKGRLVVGTTGRPCNIYFAIFSITVTINIQYLQKNHLVQPVPGDLMPSISINRSSVKSDFLVSDILTSITTGSALFPQRQPDDKARKDHCNDHPCAKCCGSSDLEHIIITFKIYDQNDQG